MRFVRLPRIIFQRPTRLAISAILVGLFIFVVVPIVIPPLKTPKQRITEESSLGSLIPDDARDLEYEIGPRSGFFLKLRFKAPSHSVQPFLDKVCHGVLHEGYDPFNAVDSPKPSPGAYLIKVIPGYYSYSPNTPPTIFGNRCAKPVFSKIRVDKTDPQQYAITFEERGNCDFLTPVGSCVLSGAVRFLHPINDFGLYVAGIWLTAQEEYELVLNEMCLEIEDSSWGDWNELGGAKLRIAVDQQVMPSAMIMQDSGALISVDSQRESYSLFNYCLPSNWREGWHEMEIHVTTISGKRIDYAWKFLVGETF